MTFKNFWNWKWLNTQWKSFEESSIGKFLLDKVFFRSKSFYTILYTYGLILLAQLVAYNSVNQWAEKIDGQLEQSTGLLYAFWFFLSFFLPEGNLLIIVALILMIVVAVVIRYKEIPTIFKPKKVLSASPIKRGFVGREDEVIKIEKALKSSSSLLLINGIGGIGKTSLATYYLEEHNSSYEHTAFISVLNDVRLSLFNEFEKSLNLSKQESIEADFREVLGALYQLKGQKLLILDDIKEVGKQKTYIEEVLKLRTEGFELLFTSRESIEDIESHYLDVLNEKDAKALFNSIYKVEDEKVLKEVLRALDYHTYFIEMTAKTLKNNPNSLTAKKLLQKFKNGEFSKVNKSKEESFFIFLDELFSFEKLDKEMILLLQRLSVLPSIEIEFQELIKIFKIENEEEFELHLNFLVAKGWLLYTESKYKLHQIIKEYIFSYHLPSFENVELLIDFFTRLIEHSADAQVAINNSSHLVYLESVENLLDKIEAENEITAGFLLHYGNIYYFLGAYEKAEHLYLKELKINEKVLGEEHPKTTTSYNNLAELYRLMGAYAKAEPLYDKALKIREEVLGEEHPDTATSYNNLALLYGSMGAYKKAELLFEKALKIREEVLGEEHPSTATSYNNLARLYKSMGAYEKVEPLYSKALKIREKVLGEEHPDTASSYNNLAGLYVSMGAYEKAEPLSDKALKISEKVLGKEHPNTASSYNNLAELYRLMGAYEKAEPLYLKSLKIWENVLGAEHPDTANSYNNLAVFYYEQDNFKDAYKYMFKAIAVRKKTLPSNHPDLIESKRGLEMIESKMV